MPKTAEKVLSRLCRYRKPNPKPQPKTLVVFDRWISSPRPLLLATLVPLGLELLRFRYKCHPDYEVTMGQRE